MTLRLATLVAAPLIALAAGGCSQAQDIAADAASQAGSRAATAAADEVKRQICGRVQDGQVSAQDKQVLAGLVSSAKAAGVPAEVTTPLDQIARAGDKLPAESVAALSRACAPSPTAS
ncbi:MAG: putative lipoprotein [Frankiales bacterium]|jgi:hypothetical protein|nr:putative lipoprotein [Frankiales bacterium]